MEYLVKASPMLVFKEEIKSAFSFRKFGIRITPSCHTSLSSMKIGIDPGARHMGITILYDQLKRGDVLGHSYEILAASEKNPITRMRNIRNCLEEIMYERYRLENNVIVIIEGSSYGERYGQATLAEARASVAIFFKDYRAMYIPPRSIRKNVFGNGTIRAEEIWKGIMPPNALSSLCCALYTPVEGDFENE